jgi:hypothetical protein
MRSPQNQLIKCLKDTGIQPSSFAYFLTRFIAKKPAKIKLKLTSLLTAQMKAQAELIRHHLTRQDL